MFVSLQSSMKYPPPLICHVYSWLCTFTLTLVDQVMNHFERASPRHCGVLRLEVYVSEEYYADGQFEELESKLIVDRWRGYRGVV